VEDDERPRGISRLPFFMLFSSKQKKKKKEKRERKKRVRKRGTSRRGMGFVRVAPFSIECFFCG